MRRRGKSLGNFTLEHQRQALIVADSRQPSKEQWRGDVVGQVRDDFTGRIRELCWIEPQCIAHNQSEALRVGCNQVAKGGETAWVALNRDDPVRTGCKERPCQAARAGADLDNR